MFLRGLLRVIAAILLVVVLGAAGAAGVEHLERWSEIRTARKGEALFQKTCSRCHDLQRIAKPRRVQDWEEIVERVARKSDSGIDDATREAITTYLQVANGYFTGYRRGFLYLKQYRPSAEKHWKERCSTCHPLSVARHNPEEPGVLYAAIERDRRMNVFHLPIAARDIIFDYLHLKDVELPFGLLRYRCTRCHSLRFTAAYVIGARLPQEEGRWHKDAEVFARRCYVCHTPDIRKRCRTREEWTEIVARMRGKTNVRISEEEGHRTVNHLVSRTDCVERWDNAVLPEPLSYPPDPLHGTR